MVRTFLLKVINLYDQQLYAGHTTYHAGDSGLDLFVIEDQIIQPQNSAFIDFGVACQCRSYNPRFWEWFKTGSMYKYHSYMLMPRSSICKTPLIMHNSVGLIDAGYLGPIKMPVFNTSTRPYLVKRGERYAQLVNANLSNVHMKLVDTHRQTSRGLGGFGSTSI
ncbi:hypothetical protein EBU95_02220 [bacterium]|nr:hypothetical protein [bacterium]